LYEKLVEDGRKNVEKYEAGKVASAYYELYKSL